jgi:hypothetical protein
MSAEAEAAQTEAQAAQVELEYHREEKRENKVMDTKLVVSKFNPNLIVRAYGDNLSNGSVSRAHVHHGQVRPSTQLF